jgi:hypothetical protein
MLRECDECGVRFETNSPQKARAGGKIGHCPDCSSEATVKYLGLQAGDGKQAGITVLSFGSVEDRSKYADFWRNNSGIHKGKSCQLGSHLSTSPGVSFKTVTQSGATNHKGRAS